MKDTKRENGITLIALTITIIVLIIIASISTNAGISSIQSSKLTKFKQELEIMQAQVDLLYEECKNTDGTIDMDKVNAIGKDLTNLDSAEINEIFSSLNIDNTEDYRYYDTETIENLDISGVENEFLVSIKDRDVISIEGFESDGIMYRSLYQFPDKERISGDITRGDVTFSATSEKTNDGWNINISDIKFSKYVGKGIIKYKESNDSDWTTIEENAKQDDYTFKVTTEGKYIIQITDAAGILAEQEIEIIEISTREIKPGDYIIYNVPDKQFTISASDTGYTEDQTFDTKDVTDLWQILYNRDGELEITSSEAVANLKLNRSWTESNFNYNVAVSSSQTAHNKSITTLNAMCQNYINEEYAVSSRIIGTNPSDPTDKITTYVTTVKGSNNKVTNPGVKIGDNYYQEDYEAMKSATSQNSEGIVSINQDYYLGSRAIQYERGISDYLPGIATEDEVYGIRYISQTGELSFGYILGNSTGAGMNHVYWHQLSDRGIRPVIKLKNDITILTGTGTKDDPYILK